jgi:Ca2+-binding EF-hand superfamily protein
MNLLRAACLVVVLAALPLHAAKGEGKKKSSPADSFETFDHDKDGAVTEKEYLDVMKKVLGESTAKERFAALDKNGDGKLTKDEFGANGEEPKKRRAKKKA